MQDTPAGLPFGMPGKGLVIDGATQHAPQFVLQSIKIYAANNLRLDNIDPRKTNATYSGLDILHRFIY